MLPKAPRASSFSQVFVHPGRSWFQAIRSLAWGTFWGIAGPLALLELLWLATSFVIVAPFALLGGKVAVLATAFIPLLKLFGEGYLGQWTQLLAAILALGVLFVLTQNLLLRILPRAPRPGLSLGIRAGLAHLWPVLLFGFYPPLAMVAGLFVMPFHVRLLRRSHGGTLLAPILSHGLALALVFGLGSRLPQDLRVDLLPWFSQGGTRLDLREVETPRKRKEHLAEIAALRAHPYVEPQNLNYEMARKDLPPDVRFLIAKESSGYNPEAMRWLGDYYYEGVGVARDPKAALEWWGRAIQRDGNAQAKISKGVALLEGKGLARDEALGKDLILSVIRWAPGYRDQALARLVPVGLAQKDQDLEANLRTVEVSVIRPDLHGPTRALLEDLRARVAANPQLWVYTATLDTLQLKLDPPPPAPPPSVTTRPLPPSPPSGTSPEQTALPISWLIADFRGNARLSPPDLRRIQGQVPMAETMLGLDEFHGANIPKDPRSGVLHMEEGLRRASQNEKLEKWFISMKTFEALGEAYQSGEGASVNPVKADLYRRKLAWIKDEHYLRNQKSSPEPR